MNTQIVIDDDIPVIVELYQVRGIQDVAVTPDQLINVSRIALNNAMVSVHGMARRVISAMKSINYLDRPDAVEVKFGLKLTTDANAFVVNAGTEAQVEVTIKWEKKIEEQ